jgi:16S rRNA (cytosine1402-N4)-methyltransferase
MSRHIPVLLKEVLYHLNLKPGQTVIDATLGAGGYSTEIVQAIEPNGTLITLDRDKKAVEAFQACADKHAWKSNVQVLHSNFTDIKTASEELGITSVDAIVADLGISSDQLDDAEKGLSFLTDGPLDMRLDNTEETPTAADIVNTYNEQALVTLFKTYAQEKYARSIARGILSQRKQKQFSRVAQLVDCIEKNVPVLYRNERIHCATRVFMALRMKVNKEVENLQLFMESAISLLHGGGKMAIVTFHSIEDRMVKEFIRSKARGCVCPDIFPVCRCGIQSQCKNLTSKPISPSLSELEKNPRSRSAKLRVLEKKEKQNK